MPAEFIGYAAASLTTISFFPQALKTLRSGDTRSISLGMYAPCSHLGCCCGPSMG